MMIEIEPAKLNRTLLSVGLSEQEVRKVNGEFSKNNSLITDEGLLEILLEFNKDTYTIITIFDKIGIGKNTAIRMMEMRQRQKLGTLVNVYNLEVED
jgi:hypothetical protein